MTPALPSTPPPDGAGPRRAVVLDGDPGHDDAIAWLLAAGSPELEVLALTTVAGNQTLAKVSRGALAVAALAGPTLAGVPVAAGADRPLVREVVLMGGAVHGGNWTAAAEFYILVDPEAA